MPTPNQSIREFPYRPNRVTTAFLLFLACCGECLFIYFALYADRGVSSVRGIELTRDQFRVVMGIMAVLGPVGIVLMALLLISSFRDRRRVAITDHSIILPKPSRLGLSREEIEIPFDEIRSVGVVPFSGRTVLLMIIRPSGPVSIPSNMFPTRRDFDAITELLEAALARRNDH